MSNSVTQICRPLRMSAAQKSVLMCISDRANDAGEAWPSIPGICEWTCLSRTAVIEAMKWLEAQGLMSVEKAIGKNNRCHLNLELIEGMQPVRQPDGYQSATRTRPSSVPVRQEHSTSPPGAPPPVRQADYTRPPGVPEASISISKASTTSETPAIGFDEFWSEYPNRKAKQSAVKAWAKLKPDIALQADIRKALASQRQSDGWRKDGGKFVPHAATWLNGRRWEDEIGSATGSADDSRPAWAVRAGFATRYDAENAGCNERSAPKFRNGHRIEATA